MRLSLSGPDGLIGGFIGGFFFSSCPELKDFDCSAMILETTSTLLTVLSAFFFTFNFCRSVEFTESISLFEELLTLIFLFGLHSDTGATTAL